MSQGFLKPRSIEVEPISKNHAKVIMEPFERGYGHTLGNALRRVLLSSMPGYAPTEVQIAGVVHEYSTLPGVGEDVVDILMNLKGVVFKLHSREEVTLILRKEGAGQVLASDIELPHDVEIINPNHVIATLTDDGKLEMQIKVEQGRARCSRLSLPLAQAILKGEVLALFPLMAVSSAVRNSSRFSSFSMTVSLLKDVALTAADER